MKKLFVFMAITILIVCAAQAQDRQMVKVAVPFSFMAENTTFPAGTIAVYLLNPYNLVRVQSLDGRQAAVVRGTPSKSANAAKPSGLVFERIDGQLFLVQIRDGNADVQRTLPLGVYARELMAKNHNQPQYPNTVTISTR